MKPEPASTVGWSENGFGVGSAAAVVKRKLPCGPLDSYRVVDKTRAGGSFALVGDSTPKGVGEKPEGVARGEGDGVGPVGAGPAFFAVEQRAIVIGSGGDLGGRF